MLRTHVKRRHAISVGKLGSLHYRCFLHLVRFSLVLIPALLIPVSRPGADRGLEISSHQTLRFHLFSSSHLSLDDASLHLSPYCEGFSLLCAQPLVLNSRSVSWVHCLLSDLQTSTFQTHSCICRALILRHIQQHIQRPRERGCVQPRSFLLRRSL